MRSLFWLLLIFSLLITNFIQGQSYIADTVIAKFSTDSVVSFNHSLSVTDFRDEDPRFLSIYEKKKWLFFPVDQIVFTQQL